MRYIRNISDDQNKSGDTDNTFRFNLLQDEDIFNFGDYPISINIANSSGYILSMVPEKEFGNSVVKLDFNDQSLKSLTPDDYLLEVEVKLPDGTTATFPTKGGMPFSVNSNLKNTAGKLVPSVTFDEVLNAVDKKVNNYLATVVKGDKGDPGEKGDTGVVDTAKDYTWNGTNTFNKKIIAPAGIQGPIDNTSLINTPAFQSLQTKVVGTNLLIGTATPASITGNNSGNQTKNTYSIARGMSAYTLYQKYGSTFTLSYDWSVTDTASAYTGQMQQQFNWNPWGFSDITTISSSNTSGHKVITFTLSNSSTNTANGLAFRLANVPTTSTITVSNMKLEKGNVATDWCPAPEDVPSNDAQLVHKTGTETAAGDKTFTGNNTFTQNISGNITGNSATTTKLQTPRKINGTNFDGTADINVNAANDSNLVHRTGNETVAGDKTFTGLNTFTGQTSFWFKQIQWTSGIMQGTWYIQRIGNWVNAKFDMSANTGTGTTTISLPVGYRPLSPFVRELEQGAAGIANIGTVFIGQVYTGANAMTFSYPTNDVWPTA